MGTFVKGDVVVAPFPFSAKIHEILARLVQILNT